MKQTCEVQTIRFKKRLNKWIKEFDALNKISSDKKLTKFREWIERKKIAAGLKKDRMPIIKTLLAILKKKSGL
jgi:hypothetical protein